MIFELASCVPSPPHADSGTDSGTDAARELFKVRGAAEDWRLLLNALRKGLFRRRPEPPRLETLLSLRSE